MTGDDMTLVRAFVESRSEATFTALVERHIGLVYSSAMRQMGDAHSAQEVAQMVFIQLARKAASLGPGTVVSAWLYRTTLYTAADARKARRRRTLREQEAGMQINPPESDAWEQVAPLLDEALAGLGEADRTALVLRYFENKTAREIGEVLQTGEEAAQKRIARALDKLRGLFAKRGVTLSVATIAAAVGANAVQAVPAGMAATISSGALATTTLTTTVITMTLLQKIAITAALTVTVGAGIYATKQTAIAREQSERQASLAAQVQQLEQERDDATNRLARLQAQNAQLGRDSQELLALRSQVGLLQKKAQNLNTVPAENKALRTVPHNNPGLTFPDLTPEEQQQIVGRRKLTNAKEGLLGVMMFAEANQQQYPANFDQLANYIANTNTLADLNANYEFTYRGLAAGITNPAETIVLREKQPWQTTDGGWIRTYGFADGHSELHKEQDGNFDQWESQRLMPPANGQ